MLHKMYCLALFSTGHVCVHHLPQTVSHPSILWPNKIKVPQQTEWVEAIFASNRNIGTPPSQETERTQSALVYIFHSHECKKLLLILCEVCICIASHGMLQYYALSQIETLIVYTSHCTHIIRGHPDRWSWATFWMLSEMNYPIPLTNLSWVGKTMRKTLFFHEGKTHFFPQ